MFLIVYNTDSFVRFFVMFYKLMNNIKIIC